MFIFRICLFFSTIVLSSLFGSQKIALFNDTSAWYHWGCTGTSTALKEEIQKLGFEIEAFPIKMTYSLKEVPSFEGFNDAEKFEQFCKENPSVIQAIQSSDAVVITGEGTIHALRPAPLALLYVAHISKKYFNKHVEIINHSAYPSGIAAQKVYQTVYSELDYIAIREPLSQSEMNKIAIDSTLSFDCLPLYIRDHYHTPKRIQKPTLVIAGSVAHTEPGVKHLCKYMEIASECGFDIKVLTGAAASPALDDQAFVTYIEKHCRGKWKLVEAASMEEWLDTINQATLLVSGRFHHSIAAYCLNTPFIALNSNTQKLHSLCALLKQKEPLLYSDPQLLIQLMLRTSVILHTPQVYNGSQVTKICELAEKNFDGLRACLQNSPSP